MPERIKLSAHQLPTPPIPKMITRFAAAFSIKLFPKSSSVRWKISFQYPLIY